MNRAGGLKFVAALRCLRCGRAYRPDEIDYLCACRPNAGSDLGTLDVIYDYPAILTSLGGNLPVVRESAPMPLHFLLPIARIDSLPPAPAGNTPLYHAVRLGGLHDTPNLLIKDEGRNPSGSLKDRASAIAVAKAQEAGYRVVATASTGNAAAALANQAAAAGMQAVIFVPKSAPPAKLAQLLVFGAQVFAVRGSYDQAFDLCVEACARFGWYNRNTGMNPYMTEGKKTVAYEIAAQLAIQNATPLEAPSGGVDRGERVAGRLRAPDAVFVAVGDGCIIGGVHKGFYDLHQLGWIDKMPRLYGVQSAQSAALYRAWRAGVDVPQVVQAATRADSISVNAPRDAVKALRAVRTTGGAFVLVEDESILRAIPVLARRAAVFAEPAGAAAYAGFVQAQRDGLVHGDETVVLINTGSGLKDIGAVRAVSGEPVEIDAGLDAVSVWVEHELSAVLES